MVAVGRSYAADVACATPRIGKSCILLADLVGDLLVAASTLPTAAADSARNHRPGGPRVKVVLRPQCGLAVGDATPGPVDAELSGGGWVL